MGAVLPADRGESNGKDDKDAEKIEITSLKLASVTEKLQLVDALLADIAKEGRTALENAVISGNKEAVSKLLDRGADLALKDENGANVVHLAVIGSNLELAKFLHEKNGSLVHERVADGSTALHLAVRKGVDLEVVSWLSDELKLDVDAGNNDGLTPLMLACLSAHSRFVEFLLTKSVDVNKRGLNESTAMHFAAMAGSKEAVKALLNHGADIELKNKFGANVLHKALVNGSFDVVRFLHEKNAKLVDERISDGSTALHLAVDPTICNRVDLNVVSWLLEESTLDVDAVNNRRQTALMTACLNKDLALIDFLLAKNASVKMQNSAGWSPLQFATRSGSKEAVQKMLDHGASLASRGTFGVNALHVAVAVSNFEMSLFLHEKNKELVREKGWGYNPLHLAAMGSDKEEFDMRLIVWLLEEIKLDVNSLGDTTGETALMIASRNKNLDLIEYLLTKKVDLNVRDHLDGRNALEHAVSVDNFQVVQKLLDHVGDMNLKNAPGANAVHLALAHNNLELAQLLHQKDADLVHERLFGDTTLHMVVNPGVCKEVHMRNVSWLLEEIKLDVNAVNDDGRTALMIACLNKNLALVDLLLAKNAKVNTKNDTGWTALFFAIHGGSMEVVQKLVDHGADLTVKDSYGSNVLHHAVALSNLEISQYIHTKNRDLAYQRDSNGKTALHAAFDPETIKNLDIRVVAWLLVVVKIDVNALSNEGETALMLACVSKNPDVVDLLLRKNAAVNTRDSNGLTALNYALIFCSTEVVQKLLDRNADLNWKNSLGLNILHFAVATSTFEIVRLLHRNKSNLVTERTNDGSTALHLINEKFFMDYDPDLVSWLIDKLNVDVARDDGVTALMLACRTKNVLFVNFLLAKNADVNKRDLQGITALHHAMDGGSEEIVQKLLDHGGDLSLKANLGANVLHYALFCSSLKLAMYLHGINSQLVWEKTIDGSTALHVAVGVSEGKQCDPRGVKWLLDEIKMDVNSVNGDGETALMLACRKKSTALVYYLLSKNADPNVQNRVGLTALHLAAYKGSKKAVQKLLESGADVTLKDKDGRSVLNYAVKNLEVIAMLYEKNKALFKEKTEGGNTVLHLATVLGDPSVVSFLLNHTDIDREALNKNKETALSIAIEMGNSHMIDVLRSENVKTKERRGNKEVENGQNVHCPCNIL